jgi:DNA-binding CsgD family transcriptional regulator
MGAGEIPFANQFSRLFRIVSAVHTEALCPVQPWTKTERPIVKKVRAFPNLVPQSRKNEGNPPNTFVFCEKSTGASRFHAETSADPNYIIERMAGLLAVQCLVRGTDPGDFAILVPAATTLADRLVSRAKELLEEGRANASPETLSPRQKEILQSVVCNRANKEIASRLNITVRTVKFHVSALLTKFGVENRNELARRAAGFLHRDVGETDTINLDRRSDRLRPSEFPPISLSTTLRVTPKTRGTRFGERTLTA